MSEDFTVLRDLQTHLRTAQVPFEQLSTLAQQGDDLHWTLPGVDYKLVEKFLTENIRLQGSGPEVLQSQLYISCFWGMRDIVQQLLSKGVDVNFKNKGTLWTPLHAATFQEHGPVVMVLLENGANPEIPDSEGRTPKDFASASDKIWPHFAALGLERTPRWELIEKSVIKKIHGGPAVHDSQPRRSIKMASDSRPESAYAYNSDPFIHAAVTGDVLADQEEATTNSKDQPQFSMWR
ncbi:poly [ADP-ribose] polymerase tankyrase-2-like isoform X1 [Saccostrea echinata]|uniref:poly [ADP-ribose] polymerase tankyrase-2-like isoform X1 n=1 Tax=Saccostrea echinata TaxID=191078 RepID=UPI002A81018D|nr:poly [ADP-ribose] polymerase tankyrase-2-like isoform X1 [Saccostrea echinata]